MLIRKILNIVLVIALLISIIGVTTSRPFCRFEKTEAKCFMAKSCCKDVKESNSCCELKYTLLKLDTDLFRNGHLDNLPDVLLFAVAYFYVAFEHTIVQDLHDSYYTYDPPTLTEDIPVINQVFRI